MTREDIIRMAREAGLAPICEACNGDEAPYAYESWDDELERFAALVATEVRKEFFTPEEADIALNETDFSWHNSVTQEMVDKLIAIRARNQS